MSSAAGSNLPDLRFGPVPLSIIRNEARRHILAAIDSRRGKKLLVLDPKISAYLGFLTETALLREHGVERLLHLESGSLGEVGVRSVVYFVRATIPNAQIIADQVKDLNRAEARHDVSVFFIPERSILCERLLKQEGVYGDIVIGDIPVDWVPYDTDILSLERKYVFREQLCEDNCSSLHRIAQALTQLQATYGPAREVKGIGTAALQLQRMLSRLREEQAETPAQRRSPSRGIDTLILLDRAVDVVTPCCTQLTYEGLIDEVFGIVNGAVQLESGSKQKMVLNSSDKLFAELRDMDFPTAAARVNRDLKRLKDGYDRSKNKDASVSQIKDFTGELKAHYALLERHALVVELITKRSLGLGIQSRMRAEQLLLDSFGLDTVCETIEELIADQAPLQAVLRLMVLITLTAGGIPKKFFDPLRREVLHTYGHENILTLSRLQEAGLLRRQEGSRSNFSALRRALQLLVDSDANAPPDDIAYTYSGYAPISVRLVEHATKSGCSWAQIEDALKLLPGPHFEHLQQDANMGPTQAHGSGQRRLVVVMFIGGVTFAEVAALRWLSRRPDVSSDFLVCTTKLVSGSSLLSSCMDDSVLASMAQAQVV